MQLAEQVRREQESRREVQEEMRNLERIGARLRGEVQDLHLQLQRRVQELENTRDELQQHQNQIEVSIVKYFIGLYKKIDTLFRLSDLVIS
jgi:chromosome segregation ATPase